MNSLYQALVDVYRFFEKALCVFRFGVDDSQAIGCGGGEIMLWWGSHLGAIRDQALIAWDYDIGLVCLCKPRVCMATIWHGVSASLAPLGYKLTQHGDIYHISLEKPLSLGPMAGVIPGSFRA